MQNNFFVFITCIFSIVKILSTSSILYIIINVVHIVHTTFSAVGDALHNPAPGSDKELNPSSSAGVYVSEPFWVLILFFQTVKKKWTHVLTPQTDSLIGWRLTVGHQRQRLNSKVFEKNSKKKKGISVNYKYKTRTSELLP